MIGSVGSFGVRGRDFTFSVLLLLAVAGCGAAESETYSVYAEDGTTRNVTKEEALQEIRSGRIGESTLVYANGAWKRFDADPATNALLQEARVDASESDSNAPDKMTITLSWMDAHLVKKAGVSETYMLFGATDFSGSDMIGKISLSGLPLQAAREIYKQYPDFHKCASPGASKAEKQIQNLSIIPANDAMQSSLRNVVSKFDEGFRNGNRVCVRLKGSIYRFDRAVHRESGEDVTSRVPSQIKGDYIFVESVEIVDAGFALAN